MLMWVVLVDAGAPQFLCRYLVRNNRTCIPKPGWDRRDLCISKKLDHRVQATHNLPFAQHKLPNTTMDSIGTNDHVSSNFAAIVKEDGMIIDGYQTFIEMDTFFVNGRN